MPHFPRRFPVLLATLLLGACMSYPPAPSVVEVPAGAEGGQMEFALASGDYLCDLGVRVGVARDHAAPASRQLTVRWSGRQYQLQRDPSYSGLPRFEDRASGLVWIDLPWKSVLLDGHTHKPLATECRPA